MKNRLTRRATQLLGLVCLAGCGGSHTVVEMPAPPPAPIKPAVVEPAPVPATVNIFGEFPGQEHQVIAANEELSYQQHTVAEEGYDADVAVDPSGKWLAFASTRHSEHADVYLQRVDGTSVIQLTSDRADDVQPAFSPDGKRIAFASSRSGNWDLYLMDLDGRNIEQVTNTPAQEMHPSFSPDGTRLAYCSLSPRSDQWELWTVNIETHERKMIGHGLFPVWSPQKDVERIAFQKARQRGSRWFSLWTVDLVGGEPRRLTEVAASSQAAIVSPSWNPDGSKLAFTTIVQPNGADETGGRRDVWVMNQDGASRQRLTDGNGSNVSPYWASSNRIYFISDRGGHENVWSVQLDSTAAAATVHAPHAAHEKTTIGATDSHEVEGH